MNSVATTRQQDSQAFGEAVIRKVTKRLVPLIMVLYFISFLDRVNVGFAALTMNKDLGLSATVFGAGAGIFFVGYLLAEVPSNLALEKFGARIWIARIMITWGLISAAMAFTQGAKSFYALRFFLGVAEGGFFPGMLLYLTYWFPLAYRSKVISLYMVAIPMSTVIGAPVSGFLLGVHGGGFTGWQWLFILEGLPAVLLGFLVLFCLTDRPEKANWLTPAEKEWLVGQQSAERKMRESVHHLTLRQALLYPAVLLFGVIHIAMQMASYSNFFWLPQIMKAFGGVSNMQVGFLAMIPWAFAAAAMYLNGWHADRTSERVWHAVVPSFICTVGLAFSGSSNPIIAMVAITASCVGIMAFLVIFWSLPPAMLSGTAAAGGIALISAIGNTGSYIGPFVVGYLKDRTHTYSSGLMVISASMFVATILTLMAANKIKKDGLLKGKSQ